MHKNHLFWLRRAPLRFGSSFTPAPWGAKNRRSRGNRERSSTKPKSIYCRVLGM